MYYIIPKDFSVATILNMGLMRLPNAVKKYLPQMKIIEQIFYCSVWICGVLIALWQFVRSTDENYRSLDPNDFQKGWSFLHRSKDSSDMEWLILTAAFKQYWILFAIQIFCSQILLNQFVKIQPLFHSSYSFSCLVLIIGVKAASVYLFYVLFMYIIHTSGKKILCYGLTIVALFTLNNLNLSHEKEFSKTGEMELFLFEVGLAWLMARGLSFSVDRIDCGVHRRVTVTDIALVISYCLYLPTVFTGPILTYKLFSEQISSTQKQWSAVTFSTSFIRLLYHLLWYFVLEFLLHFLYSSSIQYYPEIVSTFNMWSLCGLGYALPLLFYLKYFVIYGLAGAIAKLEKFEFPPPPKCVSCIHLSSFLWRHFDRGLYLWILRYLYLPLINGKWCLIRKLYALSVCFAFVSIWHGMDKAICMWSILNFLLVTSEMISSYLLSTKAGKLFERSFSAASQKRLCALFATPHFMMMCASCTFFLSNWDIGALIFQNIICVGIIPVLPTAFIMYCGCRTSMDGKQFQCMQ